jgi:hypothetical protein
MLFFGTQERIERNLLYQDNYRSTEGTEGKLLENKSSHLKRKKTGRFFLVFPGTLFEIDNPAGNCPKHGHGLL